jgi:hypothetical protein
VPDPKFCVLLSWTIGSTTTRFRIGIDGTYVKVEKCWQDFLGCESWRPYDDRHSVSESKLIGAALRAVIRGEYERVLAPGGVVVIDIPGAFEETD